MVKNSIQVFARIKRTNSNQSVIPNFEITTNRDSQEIVFVTDSNYEYKAHRNSRIKFKFCSILDQSNTQKDTFDIIAKPVITRVLEGYNGTIFAYGQTGSGKTYSITGATDFENRGIIPRSISYIFDYIRNNTNVLYSIYISYFEIYNEIAYDLLNPRHRATQMEELPRVVILEDSKGETHLRNLNVISVASEDEAMNLLFLGDTNRTIAETPMNLYSSRSHCIFTIYVSRTMTDDGRVCRSKLHLVDLAGSERLQKSSISRTLLTDAKQINLSLHYLEQVFIALSDSKRVHVPYRNSVMTTVLRDSLGGNCLTAMLATLSIDINNLEETISTCKFAQRVAMVSTEPIINEIGDPAQEIVNLKTEIEKLKQELIFYKNQKPQVKKRKELTEKEVEECENNIATYLKSPIDYLAVDENSKKTEMYFKIFKRIILNQQTTIEKNASKSSKKQFNEEYESVIKQKNSEISILINLLDRNKLTTEITSDISINTSDGFLSKHYELCFASKEESDAFEIFKRSGKNNTEIKSRLQALQEKYLNAKELSNKIHSCKQNIVTLKKQIRDNVDLPEVYTKCMSKLREQQNIYRESILQLQGLKNETEHLKHAVNQAELRLIHQFKEQNKSYQLKSNYCRSMSQETQINPLSRECSQSDYYRSMNQETQINPLSRGCSQNLMHQRLLTFSEDQQKPNTIPDFRSEVIRTNTGFYKNQENDLVMNIQQNDNESDQLLPNYRQDLTVFQTVPEEKLQQFINQEQSSTHVFDRICTSTRESLLLNNSLEAKHVDFKNIGYVQSNNDMPQQSNYNTSLQKYFQLPSNNHSLSHSQINSNEFQLSDSSIPEKLSGCQGKLPTPNRFGDFHSKQNIIKPNMLNGNDNKCLNESEMGSTKSEEFWKQIPLTGDPDIDDEIIAFYKAKRNISGYK